MRRGEHELGAFLQTAQRMNVSYNYSMCRIRKIDDPGARSALCSAILADLPEWFGRPDATRSYVKSAATQTTFALEIDDLQAGVISLSQPTSETFDIHVMGVLRQYHRLGGGSALVAACENHARSSGGRFLTVQTIGPSNPDPFYKQTRAFYAACGMAAFAEFRDYWGPETPMLLMGKAIL